ncbi:major capsid protein [Dipodfec virus UOA04_Rod_1048]|nr:major capsid protein [Dipodfec virus UOA04_Rod_1048]
MGCNIWATIDEGYLYPLIDIEVLPADTFKINLETLCRAATPVFPVMDNLYGEWQLFYIPDRLVWQNSEAFYGAGAASPDGYDTQFIRPVVKSPTGGFPRKSIFDYLGWPVGVSGYEADSIALRMYNLIFNEFYRFQALQEELPVPMGDQDDPNNYKLVRRCKAPGYFTRALPSPQRGPGVEIPIAGDLNVGFRLADGSDSSPLAIGNVSGAGTATVYYAPGHQITPGGSIYDLKAFAGSSASATINSLRQAFQVQKMHEKDARGGVRYTEILRNHFNVTSPDARLQRPEYLGGTGFLINTFPVAQTSATSQDSPLGQLGAYQTSYKYKKNIIKKSFIEHGHIIGLFSIRTQPTFQQGLPRMYSRKTRDDFYWPSYAHLGEQAVLNKEIYTQGTDVDEEPFGYNERYSEYRYMQNKVCGDFRSGANSLDSWHYAYDFANLPTLNSQFVQEDAPIERTLAVQSESQFLLMSTLHVVAHRPMPVRGTPGLIDHF